MGEFEDLNNSSMSINRSCMVCMTAAIVDTAVQTELAVPDRPIDTKICMDEIKTTCRMISSTCVDIFFHLLEIFSLINRCWSQI